MTKIELQLQIANRIAKKRLKAAEFVVLCAIVDMQSKSIVVTCKSIKERAPESDPQYMLSKLMLAGYVQQVELTEAQGKANGYCKLGYVMSGKGINLVNYVIQTS